MLAHFGALMEAQAVLLRQVEAGQVALAQGRAQLQQCCEEADGELTSSNEEVLQLHARLEAARRDVLKGVKVAGPPGRGAVAWDHLQP